LSNSVFIDSKLCRCVITDREKILNCTESDRDREICTRALARLPDEFRVSTVHVMVLSDISVVLSTTLPEELELPKSVGG
jgi:acyl-CoA thioesterase